jgi:hypothetical protein
MQGKARECGVYGISRPRGQHLTSFRQGRRIVAGRALIVKFYWATNIFRLRISASIHVEG